MNRYPWLMQEQRRALLVLFLYGLPFGSIYLAFRLHWAWTTLLFLPLLIAAFIIHLSLPTGWSRDKNGFHHRVYPDGRIESDPLEILNSPKFQQHLADLVQLEREGKLGTLRPPFEIGGIE